MDEEERFRYQKLWCLMTNAVPKQPKFCYKSLDLYKDSHI